MSSIGVKDGWRDLVSDFQHYKMYIFWFRMRTTRQLRSMFPVLYHSGWPSLRKWMVVREPSGILLIGAVESSWRRSNGLQKQQGLYCRLVEMSLDKLNTYTSIARRLYSALTSWVHTDHRKVEFQLIVLWISSSLILLAGSHILLILVNDFVRGRFARNFAYKASKL